MAEDKYYVYRPLIDLIGKAEGTAPPKGRGYNETLAYGLLTDGPVELVTMTLKEVDDLQTRMLRHPENRWNSSAVGWGQIVRTTKRHIESTLKLDKSLLYDKDMQDRMICYLLGVRGIDKWLAGRLSFDTLLTNLANEWASFPKPDGKGAYKGQGTGTTIDEVRKTLEQVKQRHEEGQPKEVVEVERPVPVVPPEVDEVEEEAKKAERDNWWQWLAAVPLAGIGSFFRDYPELAWAATGGVVVIAVISILGGRRLVRRVKEVIEEARS